MKLLLAPAQPGILFGQECRLIYYAGFGLGNPSYWTSGKHPSMGSLYDEALHDPRMLTRESKPVLHFRADLNIE
jgi:hypothetical protein